MIKLWVEEEGGFIAPSSKHVLQEMPSTKTHCQGNLQSKRAGEGS